MRSCFILLFLLVALGGCSNPIGASLNHPAPHLAASEVLELQLAALRETDASPRGLAQMYAFASPKSRAMVGSFEAFAALIEMHLPALVGHRSAVIEVLETYPSQVRFQVEVTSNRGEISYFEWVVEQRTSAECSSCWLNTYIHPMETPERAVTIEL